MPGAAEVNLEDPADGLTVGGVGVAENQVGIGRRVTLGHQAGQGIDLGPAEPVGRAARTQTCRDSLPVAGGVGPGQRLAVRFGVVGPQGGEVGAEQAGAHGADDSVSGSHGSSPHHGPEQNDGVVTRGELAHLVAGDDLAAISLGTIAVAFLDLADLVQHVVRRGREHRLNP